MAAYFIDYKPGPRWLKGRPLTEQSLGAHGAYLAQLLSAGRLEIAGLFPDGSGGIAIIQAKDDDEADKIVRDDPGVIEGVFVAAARRWEVRFQRG